MVNLLYIAGYYKPAYVYGGPVTAVANLCEALAQQKVKVTVLTTDANGPERLQVPLGKSIITNGVEVIYFPISKYLPSNMFYSQELVAESKRQISQSDVVFIDALWSPILIQIVQFCRRANIPSVVPLHGQLMPWALNHKRIKKSAYLFVIKKIALSKVSAFHCASPSEVDEVNSLGIPVPAFAVPYGIDIQTFACLPERGQLRKMLNINETARIILVLGRLHRVKRPALLLDSLSQVQEKDIHIVYVGPDEEGMNGLLAEIATKHGLTDRVHILGKFSRSQVMQAFVDSDLLAMPSAMESFGMAAAEALAAGLPVLTSTEVPIGQWAEEVGAGKCVVGTVDSFSNAIGTMLADPQRLREMGIRGRELARKHLDIYMAAQAMRQQIVAIVQR